MSSLHYKFRSLLTYKTVNFTTLDVSVEDFKNVIFETDGLDPQTCDLIVESSNFKRVYSGNDLIPRNSSLIIKRVPRLDAQKLPKIQDTSTSGIVSKNTRKVSEMGFIKTKDFSLMTEEERLEHVKRVSYQKYHPLNYHKKPKYSTLTDPPPSNYICNRCNRSGHWVKNCPMANYKKTTGIPIEDLMPTTADDPYAMIHPSGRFMTHRMHVDARRNSTVKAPMPFLVDLDVKKEEPDDFREETPEKKPRMELYGEDWSVLFSQPKV